MGTATAKMIMIMTMEIITRKVTIMMAEMRIGGDESQQDDNWDVNGEDGNNNDNDNGDEQQKVDDNDDGDDGGDDESQQDGNGDGDSDSEYDQE